MIDLDLRIILVAILSAAATAAVPALVGGGIAALGALAAILIARSVVSSDEGSVTLAIVVGGLMALATVSHGHVDTWGVGASVFVGAELAALGRRLAVDPEAPALPEVRITLSTITIGLAAGAFVALVSLWRATPPLANVTLVVLVLVGGAAFAVRYLHHPTD
ncbi:MAG: hypothetical protein JWM12_3977 [Ilumatobacteraceae bacterium]|nr:hypothetical protein [Ilumatobacteraceae bacterium]